MPKVQKNNTTNVYSITLPSWAMDHLMWKKTDYIDCLVLNDSILFYKKVI